VIHLQNRQPTTSAARISIDHTYEEDQGIDGRMGSKWTLGRLVGGGVWNGFTWLRIGIFGGLL
jgi:hypothetical protein